MLKALELHGFKSFADKTRFEFPPGITVVVGPNGSGKSNIVDAIKWVLGEQSAKSLRGKEMSDVIFKGSAGASSRRPSNMASATIILENADRRFAYDADEVSVCRRVYRSGESEYLINGESCRLKDIRDLFRGTGVGTDAYSLIEQGKVERMLSTNAKDRRAIFEEAAGISRFKAKKVDAQRRLARVEGNLIRLADIVEEVGSRYRSIKSQASKAARYKEHSDRLQQLRTSVGLKDWRAFSTNLDETQEEHDAEIENSNRLTESIGSLESQAKQVELKLDETTGTLARHQESTSQIRERVAQIESSLSLNQSRLDDLEDRKSQMGQQLIRSEKRTHEFKLRIAQTEQDAETAELDYRESSDKMDVLDSELVQLDELIRVLKSASESNRTTNASLSESVTQLGRSVSAAESQMEILNESQSRYSNRTESFRSTLESQEDSFEGFCLEKQRLQSEAESKDSVLANARHQLNELKTELGGRRERLVDLTNQHSGVTQRADVIEELETSLEGINAGAKELLRHSKAEPSGPMAEVVGLVADLVSVNVQHAALVDVALGEMAQFVVVDGDHLINQMADESIKLNGRVGLIQLDSPPSLGADPNVNLDGTPGVIGRADRLVQVQPRYAPFIRQLLGGTWVVKTFGEALHLHANHDEAGRVRFVTLDGEIVEADGAVVVGPKSLASGLVSRRSELRALKREIERLDEEIGQCRQQVEDSQEQERASEQAIEQQMNDNSELASRLTDQTMQANSSEKQIKQTQKQLDQAEKDWADSTEKLEHLEAKLSAERTQLEIQEDELGLLKQQMVSEETRASDAQEERNSGEKLATAAKVQLAKSEQVLDGIEARMAQYRQEYEDQQQTDHQLKQQREADEEAAETARQVLEQATQELADFSDRKDAAADELAKITQQRLEVDDQRRRLTNELDQQRAQLTATQAKKHQSQMRMEQLIMQRRQLAERMQDDYDIDLSKEDDPQTDEDLEERDQIDAEITELRKKINQIGSVNLDALQELEQLEERYLSMDAQYQDLVQAKETLEKIITRIDADSRKLFVETLEAIRINFQKLFRQTFGGGRADIILEPNVDPLEAGVEIIAQPPGKPEISNSLLSGGERALTAVSLLMAIFQFRPSPFCVLDEVDAPFDEANIGRFIEVLKSFLGWTKFVIVTHSKKTMTAATTLYGITMQESGVSKRVSVRFEDVSEDGHISEEAVRRSDDSAA